MKPEPAKPKENEKDTEKELRLKTGPQKGQMTLTGDEVEVPDIRELSMKARYDMHNIGESGSLLKDYIVPPFSVHDTSKDYWRKRKGMWAACGIVDGGRDDMLLGGGGARRTENTEDADKSLIGLFNAGTSVFDPVIAEISYIWFCPPGGSVIDPFAGGVIRGGVAGVLGHPYTGIDLSETQIAANEEAWERAVSSFLTNPPTTKPRWVHGDSVDIKTLAPGKYDFILSCPPYHDLEKYSSDPHDLSNMTWMEFVDAYYKIIAGAVELLKQNRFAVWVVGDIRDDEGFYRDLVSKTIAAFRIAGCGLYNQIIIKTAIGTAPIRARRSFKNRKVASIHQHMLVFYKGSTKSIQETFGDVEVLDG